jgi:adenine-specific DNA methylase
MALGKATSDRKQRGAFFTPPAIANFLAEWAINSPADKILEPSCGDAAFLLSAHQVLQTQSFNRREGELFGVEIHADTAIAARERLAAIGASAKIVACDFFQFESSEKFDVILGNPPFVRYQTFTGDSRTNGLQAALKQGVRLNRLSSAWAAFLIHSCSFLNSSGRLAFVLPAELLSVNYAGSVRNYLMNRFASLKIVTFEEIVFPEVQEEVILLLASGQGTTDKFELFQAKNVADLAGALGKRWSYFRPTIAEKWTNAFVPDDVLGLYRNCATQGGFENLANWGRAYLGAVTGANEFFLLGRAEIQKYKMKSDDLLPVCPTGAAHLKGLELSLRAWNELEKGGKQVFLFYPQSPKKLSKGALEYIAWGEAQKL